MTDDPLDAIRWRDELLQILYWYQGEGLGDTVAAAELLPFLGGETDDIHRHLEALVVDGYARRRGTSPPRYQLTELGSVEGGRRFADAFDGLTNQAHGECSDPRCVCKTEGPAACASRESHSHA